MLPLRLQHGRKELVAYHRFIVAQVSNLLYRRLPVGRAFAASNTASEFRIYAASPPASERNRRVLPLRLQRRREQLVA
jgi:hypothetical protein